MTPAEQARKDVEEGLRKHLTNRWASGSEVVEYGMRMMQGLVDCIAELVTPVYELAQQMDRLHAAVNRRELLLKLPLDEREAEIVRGGVDFICSSTLGDDPPCASCDALRERAERAEAERDAAYGFRETHWHAAHGGCAVEGCACGQCDNFRRAANKLAAAEADVARLREALTTLANEADNLAFCAENPQSEDLQAQSAKVMELCERYEVQFKLVLIEPLALALAATERKG